MSRPLRISLRIVATLVAFAALLTLAAILVLRSDRFRMYVQQKIVQEIERATGGRVDLGHVSFDWTYVRLDGFTLHGKEAVGEQPLLQVQTATLGLKIISVMEKKVDLASLQVEKPLIHIIVYPDGSTNFPGASTKPGAEWPEQVLDLAIRRYEITDGTVEYDGRDTPLNIMGEHLRLTMNFDPRTPAYTGNLATDGLQVAIPGYETIQAGMNATLSLEKTRIVFSKLHLATKQSSADLSGVLDDLKSPHGTLAIKATGAVREAVQIFKLPIDPSGTVNFDGLLTIAFNKPFEWGLEGRTSARGLRYVQGRLRIEDGLVQGVARLGPEGGTLRQMKVQAFGSTLDGQAELKDWRDLHVEGVIEGLDITRAGAVLTDRHIAWSGTLAGAFTADVTLGKANAVVHTNLNIGPGGAGIPIQGQVDATFDQAAGTVALGQTNLATPSSSLAVSGTLGGTLQIQLRSTNLDDLLPALDAASKDAPAKLPLTLRNGVATAAGTVTGSLEDPRFAGQVSVTNGEVEGHSFDRFDATVEANKSEIRASTLTLGRSQTEITGSGQASARNGGFDDALIAGQFTVRNAVISELLKEAGSTLDVSGTASATAIVSGSVRDPQANIAVDVQRPAGFGEQLDRIRADVHYTGTSVDLTNGIANDAASELRFTGRYQHPENNWKTGDIAFNGMAQNIAPERIEYLGRSLPELAGIFGGTLRGTGRIENGSFRLQSASADITARGVLFEGESIGDIALTAETKGDQLSVHAKGNVKESTVEANGNWTLDGDDPGKAVVTFTRLSATSLHELVMIGATPNRPVTMPPLEGFVQGGANVTVSLAKPDQFAADVTLDTIQASARADQQLGANLQTEDTVIKNLRPVTLHLTRSEARVISAEFTGRDTNFTVSGTVPLQSGARADLTVRGRVNLQILELWNPDVRGEGSANIQAAIRGSLQDPGPSVTGRLDLNNASFHLQGVDQGIDSVSGGILFDRNPLTNRNRATIENKLTAHTGPGTIDLTGSLDWSLEPGSTPIYRLKAEAKQARIRWPQDVSTTFDASLQLTGTAQSSTLSGTITLDRMVFTPRTDLFELVAQASLTTPNAATSSDYLRGMKLDVRIASAYSFDFETSLTQDVEAEIALRLQGTPLQPALLGTISVNQGEAVILGNKYTVDRGEIRFNNRVKIDPTFDMALETKAKGVTVSVTLSGTIEKPKVNFSSDPPLQQTEIAALLAVGRDPTNSAYQATPGIPTGGASAFVEAGGGVLAQAASAQLSSRLQRFFGESHVKIDPTLTGVDNLPQARLTLEQNVSKDVTITYTTNLNRTQEQLVRVQWDFNKNWSAIAVRDPTGEFSIDFQFKKSFK